MTISLISSTDAAPSNFHFVVVVQVQAVQTSPESRNSIGTRAKNAISRRSQRLPVEPCTGFAIIRKIMLAELQLFRPQGFNPGINCFPSFCSTKN